MIYEYTMITTSEGSQRAAGLQGHDQAKVQVHGQTAQLNAFQNIQKYIQFTPHAVSLVPCSDLETNVETD